MKKLISYIIVAAFFLASAIPASAAPDSKELEKAIQTVKSIIDIPQEASVFDYYYWDDPYTGRILNLNWNDTKYEKTYSVTLDEDNVISNFNAYEYRENAAIGNLTREQGQKTAEDFMNKALPANMKDFRLKSSDSNDMFFSYFYLCYINGLPAAGLTVNIDVDKQTGKVSGYYRNNPFGKNDKFPPANGKISVGEAKETLVDNSVISLLYKSYYDYEKREVGIFPAYHLYSDKFVDAVTGELISPYNMYYPYYRGGAEDASAEKAMSVENEAGLTPEEKDVVDKLAGMISKEEAAKAAISKIPGMSSGAELQSASLGSSREEKDKYLWQLRFDGCSATVNAKTGELTAFYYYGEQKGKSGTVSRESAEKAALDFIKKTASGKLADTVFSEYMSSTEIQVPQREKDVDYNIPYIFVFVRVVDGTEFPGNSISVSVDSANGRITQYNLTWYDNAVFPKIADVITAEEALDIYADRDSFDLMYIKSAENVISLVYGFIDAPAYSVDPVSGEKLSYDGKKFREYSAVDSYDDIAGKWYEGTVNALLDNGYYIEGASFKGGSAITQEEFLRYIHSRVQAYYTQDDFYDMLVRNKILTNEEKSPGSLLSRQDAAKFTVRFLGLDKAAKDGSVFMDLYNDKVSMEYNGYAAIAKSLGIMNGDADGNFNGGKTMTRGEAAVVVFNALKNR